MSRIALLPEEVASQVAAGEVVERPASVVKELVENSLDAGATRIEVLIRRGGNSFIRVVDNGCGMDRDDALLCLERHATSKIRTGADLMAIHTLGFRGEALPSIASVSRFRLTTREHGALAGTEVIVSGGKMEAVRDCGEPEGTQIEARSLFYNLPARRKFLRTENTEASHVEHVLQLQAIGHPHVGFTLLNDDRLVHQLPPGQTLRERLRDLFSTALVGELLDVPEMEIAGVRVTGLLGRAGVSRSTRQQQIIFLNGRPIENPTISHALREGYHTALMKGQHPVTFLSIEMDPAAVDVNVHPAKREVRFRDPSLVREVIVEVTRRVVESDRASWSRTFAAPARPQPVQDNTLPLIPPTEQFALRRDWSHFSAPAEAPAAAPVRDASETLPLSQTNAAQPLPAEAAPSLPFVPSATAPAPQARPAQDFKFIGVLGRLYILMENAGGLVLVDQHAAHERILFEEMRRRMEGQGVPTQRLLLPITLQVAPRDAGWLSENLDALARTGIGLEPFGAGTFKIDALPQFLSATEPSQLLRDIIDELRDTSQQTSKLRLGEDMIAKTVCRHAVKANDILREPECLRLVQDLIACELPYCCPHGRPTMIQLSYLELEKKFGRKA
ncbi:DNA mismatch repair protein MutL [Verrucomicrobiota bacterium]|jgi:DNA mismatch repair protein MutL|nr:DNA mismatch repair protein MutL [Verrucomicrobiota bacterium]